MEIVDMELKSHQKIENCLVQNGELHDYILHNACHPVNIRLLENNVTYRFLVESAVSYMLNVLQTDFSNYSELQGLSGANVGIPFNIVLLATKKGPLVLINPEIIGKSERTKTVKSNCGSINLRKDIAVVRFKEVTVRYIQFDQTTIGETEGKLNLLTPVERTFTTGTVQHEIDHNLGVLITDIAEDTNKKS